VHTVFEAEFSYGLETILAVLKSRGALSYRFLKDAKGWRVFISLEAPQPQRRSHSRLGATGVDINCDHLALARVDRFGNVVEAARIPLVTYGCTSEQTTARIGEAVKKVIGMALKNTTPLVIEKLDFSNKKAQLEAQSPQQARMLSSLAYARIMEILKARAWDAGIEVIEVNPAYTSVIGRYKFALRYGLSNHQAAAVAIARRGMQLGEKPNRHMKDQVTFPLPERNRGKHVGSFWRQVARKAAALAAHGRSALSRSRGSRKTHSEINLSVAGGIPAR
jgi:IS605 OrfB family transposase